MSPARAWSVLLLLTFGFVLMSVDRAIPQMVAEPVKREFGLSDAELGLFIGVAYGLSYGVAGLLLGPLIDRYSRKNFIAATLAIWSGLTFMTGLASNFLMLLAARAGLGAAESGGNPASLSIISDVFPPERRSSAIGIYKIGVPLGILMASALVGWIASAHGWRAAFFVAGVPGFIVAASLYFFVQEPRRGGMDGAPVNAAYRPASYREGLAFVFGDSRVAPFALGLLLSISASAALSGFSGSFLQRHHGLSLKEVGFYFGVGSALAVLSPVTIGMLADRVVRGGHHRIFGFMAGLALLTGAVALGMVLASPTVLCIACFLAWQFLSLGLTTPGMAELLTLTPAGMRGTVVALVSVSSMCVGFGTGPLIVGRLSDLIGGADSLGLALAAVLATNYALGTMLFLLTGRNAQRRAGTQSH